MHSPVSPHCRTAFGPAAVATTSCLQVQIRSPRSGISGINVVEIAGAAAVSGDIAEGSHRVVLNEVFQPHDPAAPSTHQLSRTEGKAPSANTAANSFQARSYQDLIQYSLHIYLVLDMF
jgi:hypothetical protein